MRTKPIYPSHPFHVKYMTLRKNCPFKAVTLVVNKVGSGAVSLVCTTVDGLPGR